jgi:hypothetical protein
MLEALVLSLGLMDQSYFLREDLRDRFIALLEGLREQQVVVLLGAPNTCDMTNYHELPFYTAYKWTKGASIRPFPPADFGNIILSSTENGEIRVLPLIDNSHKMPMPGPLKKSPPPPGTNLKKLTVTYDGVWNQLTEDQLRWAGNTIAFAVICGPAISNVRTVSLNSNQQSTPAAIAASPSKAPEYYFVKTPQSPALPESIGINVSVPQKQKIVPGKPCALYGSFALPSASGNNILIHLLFSQPTTPGMNEYTVTIPHDAPAVKNGIAKGYFLFDVMNTMYWKTGKRFDVPESLYVSAVCKGVFSSPKLCSFVSE